MPHHLEDGYKVGTQPDHVTPGSQSGSLITGSDTSRSKVVILTMKEGTSSNVHLMRHASKKIQNLDYQMILLLSQVQGLIQPVSLGGRFQ